MYTPARINWVWEIKVDIDVKEERKNLSKLKKPVNPDKPKLGNIL